MLQIRDRFDGGAIVVLERGSSQAMLSLRGDEGASFRQWFSFIAEGRARKEWTFVLTDAAEATYPEGWEDYRVAASYDGRRWFRVPTFYDGEALTWRHTPRVDRVHYAYFAPYPAVRRAAFLRNVSRASHMQVELLTEGTRGGAVSLVQIGTPDEEKASLWITARQHSGEVMTEWFAEGLLSRLQEDDDPVVRTLLEQAVLYVVPCVNPDGARLGNQRANGAGEDLNRSWDAPDLQLHPEVSAILERMDQAGVDLLLDVHGDERTPYCFLAGCEGNPNYTERQEFLEALLVEALERADPSFQDEVGYPRDAPGEGDLSTAGNLVGEAFDALSVTIEMPFKDNANDPDELHGWSPERSFHLGYNAISAIAACVPVLRGPWEEAAERFYETDDDEEEDE